MGMSTDEGGFSKGRRFSKAAFDWTKLTSVIRRFLLLNMPSVLLWIRTFYHLLFFVVLTQDIRRLQGWLHLDR